MTELVAPNGRSLLPVRDHRAGARLEVRDPSAATRQLAYTGRDLPIVQQWNAEQAFRLGYLANVIAYRCVQIRANAISSVPLVAGADPSKPNDINPNSPILRLLGPPTGGQRRSGPAKNLSARRLLRWTVAQRLVTGRMGWEIETAADDTPVAFWPLVSAYLDAVPSTGGVDWWQRFEYGRWGKKKRLDPSNVFYDWEPSGLDFRQAESGLQAARYDLSLVTLCDRYGMSFLQNSAVPAAVVTTTKFPDEDHKRRFTEFWAGEFGGVDNAGRTYVHEVDDDGEGPVGDSIDVKTLGLSQKDARIVETRKAALMEIAWSLGVPWSKIDASGRTFDNATEEDRAFWHETLLPDMRDLADAINMQLAPRFGDDVVWFDLRQVEALASRPINPVTASVGAPSMVFAQLMTIDEARADYGLPPLPDGAGDRMMTVEEIAALRGGNLDVGELGAAPATPDPLATPDAGDPDDEDDEEEEEDRAGEPETRVVDPEQIEARRARIWTATDAVVTSVEARWVRAWRRMFERQETATLSRLNGNRGRRMIEQRDEPNAPLDVDEVFTAAFWIAETRQLAADLYDQAVGAGLDRVYMNFDIGFDISAAWVDDFIEQRANQLAGQVTDTTYQAIQRQLTDGIGAGESIDELADRIRTVFGAASDNRATTIARTEVISAYNGAAMRGVEQLPRDVVAAAEWISTRDARTRDTHAAADGQIVRIGESFEVGANMLAYPGDPAGGASNVVNCRCAVAFLTPDELVDTLERAPVHVDRRAARVALQLVQPGEFNELAFRRILEGASA